MEALLVSIALVALAEMGDKTQLLALLLAARFRQPVTIAFGIAVATLLNHAVAAAAAVWLTVTVDALWLSFGLAISLIAMAAWTLQADSLGDFNTRRLGRFGAFGATTLLFFLAEMGDKTQLATLALAAYYSPVLLVVAGTTLGVLIANIPAIWFGDRLMTKVPMHRFRWMATSLFLILGLWILIQALWPRI
jgi:putative Ca2+/H+ antiporter (TMEM165/GDT1 family)